MVFAIFCCVSCRLVLYNVIFRIHDEKKYGIESIYHNNDDTKNYMFNWFGKLLSVWESKKSIVSSQLLRNHRSKIFWYYFTLHLQSTQFSDLLNIDTSQIVLLLFFFWFIQHDQKLLFNVSQAFKSILNPFVFFSSVFEKKHWRRS